MLPPLLALAASQPGAVFVRSIEAEPPLQKLADAVAREVIISVGEASGRRVLSERELSLMLSEQALRDCDGPDCDTAPLERSDVKRLVTGRLSRFSGQLALVLKLSDLETSSFVTGESCIVDDEDALVRCARRAGAALFGAERKPIAHERLAGVKLAVVPLDLDDVSPEVGSTLSEILLLEAKRLKDVEVISQREVTAMLAFEAERQIVNCENNVTCLLEIGGALKTDFILGGAIGKLDDTFILHLKLMDVDKGEVTRRESESFVGDARELPAVVRSVASRLLGASEAGHGGLQLLLEAAADDARVSIDGGPALSLAQVSTASLAAGKHAISIRADGYHSVHREFVVQAGNQTALRSSLTPLPTAWHEQWWVWAIAGTVVVAAAGGAALAVTQSNKPDGGDVLFDVPFPQ